MYNFKKISAALCCGEFFDVGMFSYLPFLFAITIAEMQLRT
jgi:hypothetical protein